MRKSTLFISAALTAFMLAVLFGVVSAYKNLSDTAQQAVEMPATEPALVVNAPVALPTAQPPTPVPPASITPEQAAAIASSVLGKTDLYSVELTQFEGAEAYLVTFSSGDLVYLKPDGQIVSISKLAKTVVTVSSGGGGGGRGNHAKPSNSRGEDEHEDEHEDEDDD